MNAAARRLLLVCFILAGLPAQRGRTQSVPESPPDAKTGFPDLPRAITSFGAAVSDDAVYVYGGHFGKAHHYYDAGQSGDLLQIDLQDRSAWKVVSTGPRRQGLALVADQGQLYRLGGFDARNGIDDEQDLWSVADCACFDPAQGQWRDLPAMPDTRSSFDAVVIDRVIYVVGGWAMQGDKDATWLKSACALDLTQENPIAVGHQNGKLYQIGGMQPDGQMTTRTATFDPATATWGEGPDLGGEAMEGFGPSCCHCQGRLYVSTSSGRLLRLSADGQSWEKIGQLDKARFFHRLIPVDDHNLIAIGGASMQTGKFSNVELLDISPK